MKQSITKKNDTALRISKYFGTSAKFWFGIQNDFDLEEEQMVLADLLKNIQKAQIKAI